jgi:hypothetical protein
MSPKKMNTTSFWQRLLVPLFTFFWWKRLSTPHPHFPDTRRDHVVYVKGWRTAVIDEIGCGRKTITYLFWWDKDHIASWDGEGRKRR